MRRTNWRRAGSIVTATALLFTACGGDEGSGATGDLTELEVTGGEYFFDTGDVSDVAAGTVEMMFTLEDTAEFDHLAQWVRIKDGHTVEEVLEAAAADFTGRTAAPMIDYYGGVNAIGAGQSQTSYSNLESGTYLLVDFMPAQDGTLEPFSKRGLWKEVTVTESERAPAEIEAEGTITMAGAGYQLPADFDGSGVFEVRNDGDVVHEMSIVELLDGKSADDILAFFDFSQGAPTGPPPYLAAGGYGALSPGFTGYAELDLDPGRYAMLSFITSDSFQMQLRQGLLLEFTID